MSLIVRAATEADGAACAEIYAPYVRDTAISFELEPPTPEQMSGRIASASRRHAWLVLVDSDTDTDADSDSDDRPVGYAYGGEFRSRAAYRWACEVSVYIEAGRRRTGGGRLLYQALFDRLADRGFRMAMAGMTVPNPASEGLHTAMGFEPVGTFRRVGWKHGAWHDVAWLQRPLGPAAPEAPPFP